MGLSSVDIRPLGRLSRLMAHPSSAQAETHFAGLDLYRQLGGNCIYLHGEGGETHSRQAAGRWLRERGLGDEIFVSAQIAHDHCDNANQSAIDRFTAGGVEEDVAKDLDLIGVRRLDLVTLGDKPRSPLDPVIDAMAREINAGRLRAYALANWSADRIVAAIDYARRAGLPAPAAIFTTELSLLRASAPLWPEYAPFAGDVERVVREHRLAVLAHVDDLNLGQCLLEDVEGLSQWRPHWISRWQHPDNAGIVKRVQAVAQQQGVAPRAVNVAWVLHRPFPVVGIVSLPALLTDRAKQYECAWQQTFDEAALAKL